MFFLFSSISGTIHNNPAATTTATYSPAAGKPAATATANVVGRPATTIGYDGWSGGRSRATARHPAAAAASDSKPDSPTNSEPDPSAAESSAPCQSADSTTTTDAAASHSTNPAAAVSPADPTANDPATAPTTILSDRSTTTTATSTQPACRHGTTSRIHSTTPTTAATATLLDGSRCRFDCSIFRAGG